MKSRFLTIILFLGVMVSADGMSNPCSSGAQAQQPATAMRNIQDFGVRPANTARKNGDHLQKTIDGVSPKSITLYPAQRRSNPPEVG